MNKIVLIEAKCSVGAEQIAKALANDWDVPLIEGNNALAEHCVALNVEDYSNISEYTPVVKIYLYADPAFRAAVYASDNDVDKVQAQKVIAETDAAHREKYLAKNQCEIGLTENYDLCVNMAFCNIQKGTKTVRDYVMYRILQECLSNFED